MATLNITNFLSLPMLGTETVAKQGSTTDDPKTPWSITVTGNLYEAKNTLATATVRTLWDEDADFPATFAYGFLWVDQIAYVQLITQSSNVQHRLAAKQPFVLPGYSTCLGVANTTIISAEPTLSQIDSIVLGNWSGSTLSYHLVLVL